MSGKTEILAKSDKYFVDDNFEAVITYVPLPDEVVPEKHFHTDATHVYQIPPDARIDPIVLAEELTTRFEGLHVVVLVPGREFDEAGTRHGRGGGWYDRFLSAVPREWHRVGLCFDHQFSKTPLAREPWDEPVDEVRVVYT
ncbi:MAG: 5-formyltetrahydrofolate cyclo-ligase [Candidatus Pacebacteria bacterium]|nr:5-formyltetrahydrofolate cyclo-ligase [Candidatus Paceibacterota bacterium]